MTHSTALTIGGVVAGTCVAGALVATVSSGAQPVGRAPQVQFAEQPGGHDPLPEFGRTAGELDFRGAECRLDTDGPYSLYRECAVEDAAAGGAADRSSP